MRLVHTDTHTHTHTHTHTFIGIIKPSYKCIVAQECSMENSNTIITADVRDAVS